LHSTPPITAAEVLCIDYQGHQLIVHIRLKQICTADWSVILVPERIDKMVD
jgi:hypothetical protein